MPDAVTMPTPVFTRRLRANVGPAYTPSLTDLQRRLSDAYLEQFRASAVSGPVAFPRGTLDLTGETSDIRAHYREMLGDPYVKGPLFAKVLSVCQLDMNVIPADPEDPASVARAEKMKWVLNRSRGGFLEMAWSILVGALLDGKSVCEKVLAVVETGKYRGQVRLAAVKDKDPQLYDLMTDEYLNVVAIQPKSGSTRNARYLDPADFIIYIHSRVYQSPHGMSDLRAAHRGWVKLTHISKLRMIALDKFTGPFITGKYTNEDKRAALETALSRARAEGYLTMDAGSEIQVLDLMARGTTDFESAENDAKKEISTAITGAYLQAMEGSVPDGRGSSKVHQQTSDLFSWYLAQQLKAVLNEQVVPDLSRRNDGPDVEPPTVELGAIDVAYLQQELTIDQGLHTLGAPLSRRELYARYNRTPPKDDGDAVQPAAAPPGGMPGAQPQSRPAFGFDDDAPAVVPKPKPLPPEKVSTSGDVALAGADGAAAKKLLAASVDQLTQKFAAVTATAAKRLLSGSGANVLRARRLYDDDEVADLADTLSATLATGHLLGRARIRERQKLAEERQGRPETFSDEPAPFAAFADKPVEPLPPEEALAYFRGLVPELGGDPRRFGRLMERQAFTAAAAADEVLLARIKAAIRTGLEQGKAVGTTARGIGDLLDSAGVSTGNPQYAEMVARTNMMDAYNSGATREMQDPAVQEFFPVWRYVGIRDGRQGKDHEPHFDRYYPNTAAFADVRGPRPYNCRCTAIPIDRYDWAKLQEGGARVESEW